MRAQSNGIPRVRPVASRLAEFGLLSASWAEKAAGHGVVIHAGTRIDESGSLVTSGGRVLGVAGSGDTVEDARDSAYAGIDLITFEGARYRRDIAQRAIQT